MEKYAAEKGEQLSTLFFMRFFRPFQGRALLSLFLTLLTSALGALLPLGGKALIDFSVLHVGTEALKQVFSAVKLEHLAEPIGRALASPGMVVLGMLVLGMLAGGLGLLQRWVAFRVQQEVIYNIQTALFERLLRFPLAFFRRSRIGYLMSRTSTDIMGLQTLFSESLTRLATRAAFGIFGLAVAFILSVKLAVIVSASLPFVVIVNAFFTRRLRITSADELERTAKVSEGLQETLSGMETLKAHGAEEREIRRISGSARRVLDARMRSTTVSLVSEQASRSLQFGVTLLIMLLGAYEMRRGTMTVGDYVAFTAYAAGVTGALSSMSATLLMFQPALAAASRVRELFELSEEAKGDVTPGECRGEIEFDHVTFSYDGTRYALKDASFRAEPGRLMALTGPSGAGKTTVVNLILRFFEPQSGVVRLDGHDIKKLNASWLRSKVSVVSQDVFLFDDTIGANISYGSPGAPHEEITSAAMRAGIHEEIMSLPQGYETVAGERGLTLSAGQRQRISLARAFLRDPAVLVLDEPASALDSVTERIILDEISKLSQEKTVIVVAHRGTMLKGAQDVVVLDKGELVESGTPEDLIQSDGLYKKLMGGDA